MDKENTYVEGNNITCPNCDSPNAEITTVDGSDVTTCPDCDYTTESK